MNNELSKLLIEYRTKNKISQRELAKKLDVDNAYINRIEKGIIKKLSINFIYKISKELNMNYFDLLYKVGYTHDDLEINNLLTNFNDVFKFVDDKLIENYLTIDENGNQRVSILKVLNGYKNNKINEKETLGLLSWLLSKNMYNYLTEEEIKGIKGAKENITKI